MLEGRCPKCGAKYYGWQLYFPRHQMCVLCGVGLELIRDGQQIAGGYSPFTAEEYSLDVPPSVPTPSEETKDISS
jgi:hypothetical protein